MNCRKRSKPYTTSARVMLMPLLFLNSAELNFPGIYRILRLEWESNLLNICIGNHEAAFADAPSVK